MPTSIFINYRQDDSEELAEYIRLALAGWLGEDRVFLDKESIEYGEVIDVGSGRSCTSNNGY